MPAFAGMSGDCCPPTHLTFCSPQTMLRFLTAIPKFIITALIILAMINLLIGVFLRYFVGAITDWLDIDPVPFTWVEEVGEISLAWLTLIGAAVGIRARAHF